MVKGFLNLCIGDGAWLSLLQAIDQDDRFGTKQATEDSPLVMIEYSSPNTNKPLHLGHVRNNLLGWSLAQIMEANGNKVVKTNIVNDRGIHICKSMLAWLKWGNGETPESSGKKGDHLIGDFYVTFSKKISEQEEKFKANWIKGFVRSSLCNELKEGTLSTIVKNFGKILQEKIQDEKYRFNDDYAYGISKMKGEINDYGLFYGLGFNPKNTKRITDYIKNRIHNQIQSYYLYQAQKMLVKWEQNDPEVRALWEKMNNWVYAGFDETYKKMGVSFDKIYYARVCLSATRTTACGPT